MTRRSLFVTSLVLSALFEIQAQPSTSLIKLPPPHTTGGKPLMQTLNERRSTRAFADIKLTDQVLSNLLWAAFGINRPDGRRTAPSARNWQEIDICCLTADGVFLYDPKLNGLRPILHDDLRGKAGVQDFVATAPLNLVYIANMDRVTARSGDETDLFVGADCGFIAQNVYLFCASEGLATVVRGMVDRDALGKALGLRPNQRILLSQTVGYPLE